MRVLLAGFSPVQLERIADVLDRRAGDGALTQEDLGLDSARDGEAAARELAPHLALVGRRALAHVIRAVASERRSALHAADGRLELVWTGPERDGTATRDAAVVVRELFQSAAYDVLVAGYALYNARTIFEPLCERMDVRPSLRARLVVNVSGRDDGVGGEDVLLDFAQRFRAHHWPGSRYPEVYFDPRALDPRPDRRAVMHAKCVLVDDRRSLVTSANLTEAAQTRNIELGVVINDALWCRSVRVQFDDLIARGQLRRLRIGGGAV